MENVHLELINLSCKESYLDMIKECRDDIKKTGFDFCIPISKNESFKFDINKLISMSKGKDLPEGRVPVSTYCLTNDTDKIIGVIAVRHILTERLKFRGGHIAYYIRPSERNKGYGSKMLALALKQCGKFNIAPAIITCLKSNIYSANIIIANGGILESEDVDNGERFQRYYINAQ